MDSLIEYIKSEISADYVVFKVSSHMINNSEMNAKRKIREYFALINFVNFNTIVQGKPIKKKAVIIKGQRKIDTTISLKKPPSKSEPRMWIYGLGSYINPNDEVLLTTFNNELIVIPINQDLEILIKFLKDENQKISKFDLLNKLETRSQFKASKINYLERARKNQILGLNGELFVIATEHYNLESNGREDLTIKIEHKSLTEGDGLGYDILSYDLNGNEKYIEVKTTSGGRKTPFFISANELTFMEENPSNFYIYRVFDFDKSLKKGKIEILYKNILDKIERAPNGFKCIIK